jgi:hypothetical protein
LTATNGGQPLDGASVDIGGVSTQTNASGQYMLTAPASSVALALTIHGTGLLTRNAFLMSRSSRSVNLDAIQQASGFDLGFYREFVRNGFEAPNALEPLRRLPAAPNLYIRTVDDAGQPIDAVTLDTTESAIVGTAAIWSGGRFGIASVQRGPESREGINGWLTVRWANPPMAVGCGLTQIGLDGGLMTLNYLGPCSCSASRIYPKLVRHELGHAFGFWHTDQPGDIMYGQSSLGCDGMPSAREQYHAAIAYSRQAGNTDPDNDPAGTAFLQPRTAR